MATFRNPGAREAAWGKYYRKKGLALCRKHPRSMSNTYRIANYLQRRARHEAALVVTTQLVTF